MVLKEAFENLNQVMNFLLKVIKYAITFQFNKLSEYLSEVKNMLTTRLNQRKMLHLHNLTKEKSNTNTQGMQAEVGIKPEVNSKQETAV